MAPVIGAMVYVLIESGHVQFNPEITGVGSLPPTKYERTLLLPQMLFAFTVINPLPVNVLPKCTVMLLVPCPLTNVPPVGTVQVYEVAPATT